MLVSFNILGMSKVLGMNLLLFLLDLTLSMNVVAYSMNIIILNWIIVEPMTKESNKKRKRLSKKFLKKCKKVTEDKIEFFQMEVKFLKTR